MPDPSKPPTEYYVAQKSHLLKTLDKSMKHVQQTLIAHYGTDVAHQIAAETRQEFEQLLPQIPYIGGKKNRLTMNLVLSAAALALYRVMKAHGKPVKETGKILYNATEAEATTTSRPKNWLIRRLMWSRFMKNKLKKLCLESQQRVYPENWVAYYVEGDNDTFDFGIDYTECAICKFLHKQDADELTPYLCLLDFPMSKANGTGLVRTTTLAEGGTRCDFRLKRDREVTQGRQTKTSNHQTFR